MHMSSRLSTALGLAMLPIGLWYAARDGEPRSAVWPERLVNAIGANGGVQERTREQVYEAHLDVGPGGALRMDLSDADIRVTTTSVAGVEVRVFAYSHDPEWGRVVFERIEFRAVADGSTVRIEARDPHIDRSEWHRNRGVGIVAEVAVPRQFDVDVVTEDGDISVEALDGHVSLRTIDGDVDIGAIRGTDLDVETSDGDVVAEELAVDQISIRTSDGDITMRSVSGAVIANTSDGDIDVYLDRISNAEFGTRDGDISIFAPTDLKADVSFDAEDFHVARGFALRGQIGRRRVQGTLNGGGPLLRAYTNDGEIRLIGAR